MGGDETNTATPRPSSSTPTDDADAQRQTHTGLGDLRLEIESLRLKLSRHNRWLEWVKAAGGPVAILGLVVSTIISAMQMGAARESGREDRFQRQIAHLGSASVSERLTGVSGLSVTLSDPTESQRHAEAIEFLINALAVEGNVTVRSAIVDTISQIDASKPGQVSLASHTQQLLIARDRELTRMAEFSVSQLAPERGDLSQRIGPVFDIGGLIAQFVRKGVSPENMSAIACVGCSFQGAKFPVGADFSDSILANADFSHAELKGAKFVNSLLTGAKFVDAELEDADLRENLDVPRALRRAELTSQGARLLVSYPKSITLTDTFPNFQCANLRGAHFDGRELLGIDRVDKDTWAYDASDFSGADIRDADLRSFGLVYVDEEAKRYDDLFRSVPFEWTSLHTLIAPIDRPYGKDNPGYLVARTKADWTIGPNLRSEMQDGLGNLSSLLDSKNFEEARIAPRVREYLRLLAATTGARTSPSCPGSPSR